MENKVKRINYKPGDIHNGFEIAAITSQCKYCDIPLYVLYKPGPTGVSGMGHCVNSTPVYFGDIDSPGAWCDDCNGLRIEDEDNNMQRKYGKPDMVNIKELKQAKNKMVTEVNFLIDEFQRKYQVELIPDYTHMGIYGQSYRILQMDFKIEV